MRSQRALDALNFFMADVQTGVGPYLAVFLRTMRQYGPAQIGLVMAAGSIAQISLQTPLGGLIDRTRAKRALVALTAGLTAVGAIMFAVASPLWAVVVAEVLISGSGAVFPPAIAALSLGIVGRAALATRMARNEAFNHAGNVAAAIGFGLLGTAAGGRAVFWCVVGLAVATILSVLGIRERDIDHARARGAEGVGAVDQSVRVLLGDRRLLTFVGAVILFHAANAAMLPLVGQALAVGDSHDAPLYMSAVILVAQVVMIGVDGVLARLGRRLRHKPAFLIAFAALVLRGVLFAMTRNHVVLIATQVLDGVGAGIFGVVSVLVIAELTRGTGRFNLAQGAIATAVGIGGAISNVAAGLVAKTVGFPIAFLSLAGLGALGFVFYASWMPETARPEHPTV